MPKVSPLRLLIGSSPKGKPAASERDPLLEDEASSSCRKSGLCKEGAAEVAAAITPRAKKGISFAAVYPHSENVPENLITPEKKPKGKFSWYQRQVKNLGAEGVTEAAAKKPALAPKNPRPAVQKPVTTPRSTRLDKDSHSGTGSSSIQDASVTPKRSISRSLRYGSHHAATSSTAATPQKACTAMVNDGASTQPQHFELQEDSSFWLEHNVQVLIRIRPLNNQEVVAQGHDRCIRQDGAHSLTWIGNPDTRFTFDHVACETISQERLFKVAGMPMVENCMRGYNSCVFAYGQTGSGKTHTMLGNINRKACDDRGLTPRIFEHLFETIRIEEEGRCNDNLKYTCKCSFLEIYNEQITDLLEPSLTNLQVREDARKGVYVENLTEIEVNCVQDVTGLLLQGASNRKVASTNMNRESSRSHSVLTCVIESKWEKDCVTNRRFAKLNLVDLAGSERQKATGAESERLKEAVNINKSLSTLGLVIMVLVDVANGKQRHVPYRDSKLTYLLQESLGGNSKTMVISTVSPSSSCAMETLSTLKFAQRAKFICNNAVVNEDTSRDINVLRQQIHKLKEEVNRLRNQTSGTCSSPSSLEESDAEMIHSNVESRNKRHTPSKGHTDLNKMLSVEFHKLNQLRESLEAELEVKPFNSESYQRKLQDSHIENEKLRRKITELQGALDAPQKENEEKLRKEIELLELNHSKSMKDVEDLLKESEESRVIQATSIRNLESVVNDYRSEIRELKSQLKEAKDVQEQMESQQLFLIGEFETVLEEHNKITDKLAKTEAREQSTKDQLCLMKWEVKKKEELHDLEKELETRASARSLIGFVDEEEKIVLEEKLRKTRKELEEARYRNQLYEGKEDTRLSLERQMEVTRSEVEAETANALASMNRDLAVAKEDCKAASERVIRLMEELEESKLKCRSLSDENATLARAYECLAQDRDIELQELHEEYVDASSELFDFLVEGDQAFSSAAKEIQDMIQESFTTYNSDKSEDWHSKQGPIEVLQQKLHQAFSIAKDAERKMKAITEQQKHQFTDTDEVKAELVAYQEQLKEAEKKAQVAFILVRHLESKLQFGQRNRASVSASSDQGDWKTEKEELLAELTDAKLEAAAKSKETATVLQKFKDSQHMLREAEQLLNALVKANESAKSGAQGWKEEMRKSVSEMTILPEKDDLSSKLDEAKHNLHIIKQEIETFTFDSVHAITDAEQEVQSTIKSIEENMKDILSFVFSFGDGIRDEFVELREKMSEMMGEANSLLEEIRRKNELLKGLEYDISLLQEAFSEAHEKKLELQEENEKMQDELELKTSEINGAETQLLKLLKTLTTVETELRTLKETTSYLSTENGAQREQIEELRSNNVRLAEELEVKRRLIESLDAELLEVSSLAQMPFEREFDVNSVLKERDELQTQLLTVREQLESARSLVEELELVAEKSRLIAENCQVASSEKDEEIKVLEQSVQELESTITTMENQVNLLKRDGEMHRLMKEDLEMELHRVRAEITKSKISQTTDFSGLPADKIKLLRLEEELESLLEECRLKDAQISSLRKHVSELMDTATKEACAYRRKIKRLEASLETRCAPKQAVLKATDKGGPKAKGSGSPFKCIGLGLNSEMTEELGINRRRIEELEAVASVREKEVFMLNSKLAQAESMTYDVVRDLLEVKHGISSFVHLDEHTDSL